MSKHAPRNLTFSNETLYHYFSTQLPPAPPTLVAPEAPRNQSARRVRPSIYGTPTGSVKAQATVVVDDSVALQEPPVERPSSAPSTPVGTFTTSTSDAQASAEPFSYQLNPVIEYLYNRWKLKWATDTAE